jgi:hypothetical protein
MTIPLENIFFKIFTFYKPSKEYLEIKTLYDNIKCNDEMKEIDFHKEKLISYLKNLLIEKGLADKELLNHYFLISYNFDYERGADHSFKNFVKIKLSLNFNSYADYNYTPYETEEAIISLRQYKFFDHFATTIERKIERKIDDKNIEIEQLKKKIMILEQEQVKEKIPTCYQNISYKNLNDLNAAKFITDNEKRMILGLKPINNENK